MKQIHFGFPAWMGIAAIGAMFFAAGCGSDNGTSTGGAPSVNFTGAFAMAGRNDSNLCIPNWDSTGTFSGVTLTLTQIQDSVTLVDTIHGTVSGGGGLGLGLAIGTNQFVGVRQGNAVSLVAYGTRNNVVGNCSYTVNATADLSLSGDIVTGTITYKPNTNGSPDCGVLTTCVNRTRINGVRPPAGP